ncbi:MULTISPECIES: ribosome silencing factor [unclassified Schaalia]|uniref:ribosome silencing factor n=1 Tax=unclassified Schaalia TaxID=2691889 RepID=UPI001E4FB554|nr:MULTISPECIES: ribosome silencing factor [unclassified Schaalia]
MAFSQQTYDVALAAARAAADKIAENPVLVDVSERLVLAEAFLIVSASSARQVNAVGEEIMDQLARNLSMKPTVIEGRSEGRWMLIDYGDLVVHVFAKEDREYYALEKLWADGERRELQAILDEENREASPVVRLAHASGDAPAQGQSQGTGAVSAVDDGQ